MLEGLSGAFPDPEASAGLPAHVRIEQWLMRLISDGVVLPGDKLPKEQDLAEGLAVSRMTLRQALGTLESRGVVERIPGRQGGTFIREPKIDADITGLAGFTEQLRRGQVRASARVVSATTVPASRGVAAALDVARDDDVYEIVRVRRARGMPLALERSYLPAVLFPGLLDRRLTGSLYRLLGKEYGSAPQSAVEYLEPFIATADVAGLLDVDEGSPLLLIDRTASSAAGRPVEYARDIFRSDRIRISVRTVAGESGSLRSAASD
jgi:DNA-binding GntR family transcriptional regulator